MLANISTLRNAIRERRLVKIECGPKWKFILEPYVLFYHPANQFTLNGYTWASDPVANIKGSRDFLVGHIMSVELLDPTYDLPQLEYFDRNWTEVRIDCDVYCGTMAALPA